MDGRRFDAWVKHLPGASPRGLLGLASRRGLLRGLAGSAGLAAAGLATETAASNGVCGLGCGTICGPVPSALFCNFRDSSCLCVRSTSGAIHCAGNRDCPPAGAADECRRDSDCGLNEICVKTAGGICCTEPDQSQVNICMPQCLNLTTARVGRGHGSVIGGALARL